MTKFTLKTLIPSALLAISSLASAQTPPSDVYIRGISYGGNGCPQGTVGQLLAANKKSFTLTFDEYIAEWGPGVSKRDARRFCQVTLDVHVPQGWQFSVFDFDYRGYAYLERGITGTQKSTYYWDRNYEGTFSTQLRGNYDNNFTISDQIATPSLVWSPCGSTKLLNIKSEIRLSGHPRRAGFMTVDSLDAKVKQLYGLRWKRCR